MKDYGYFGPDSVTWKIASEAIITLGGSRAVLMQLAHPLVAVGVSAHSNYMTDPFGRSARTFILGQMLTFGSHTTAHKAARTINRLHTHVYGTLPEQAGDYIKGTPYKARNPELLLWVHATLIDTILYTYSLFVRPLSQEEKEQYYQESKTLVHLLGLSYTDMPETAKDLQLYVDDMVHSNRLAATPESCQLARQLLFPPIPAILRPLLHLNYQITCALLPQRIREIYGMKCSARQQRAFDLFAQGTRMLIPHLPMSLRVYPITRHMMQQGETSCNQNRLCAIAVSREMTTERKKSIMTNQAQHTDIAGKTQPLHITLVVNGQPFEAQVNPKEIFHEALEHALPAGLLVGHRIRITTPNGDEIFPDMFIGETSTHFNTHTFHIEAWRLDAATAEKGKQTWTNFGFDHLAITVADRADARAFFSEVLGMRIVRDDRHQTVLTTGNTALFCFDAEKAPLSDGLPSRWHHIGFVVDNLDAAYHHLAHHARLRQERAGNDSGSIASDFILLERNERWSLYCHYYNGDTRLMIQLSEIKPESRGFVNPEHFTDHMYDYLSGLYGVRFEEEQKQEH